MSSAGSRRQHRARITSTTSDDNNHNSISKRPAPSSIQKLRSECIWYGFTANTSSSTRGSLTANSTYARIESSPANSTTMTSCAAPATIMPMTTRNSRTAIHANIKAMKTGGLNATHPSARPAMNLSSRTNA